MRKMRFLLSGADSARSGAALLLALIVTALLTIVTVERIDDAWVAASLGARFRDETVALFQARAGVAMAIETLRLYDPKDEEQRKLFELYARAPIPVPIADDSVVTLSISHESGKIGLNSLLSKSGAPDQGRIDIFKRLLDRLDEPRELADKLLDWIDHDDEERDGGAESAYYLELDPPYHAKNRALDSFDELGLIAGFDRELIEKLRAHVTIYSAGQVNINHASALTIEALHPEISEALAMEIVELVAQTPMESKAELNEIVGMRGIYTEIAPYVTTEGNWYLVTSTATVGSTNLSAVAALRKEPGTVNIEYYRVL